MFFLFVGFLFLFFFCFLTGFVLPLRAITGKRNLVAIGFDLSFDLDRGFRFSAK